jgi:hypothetical protein
MFGMKNDKALVLALTPTLWHIQIKNLQQIGFVFTIKAKG